MKIRNLVMIILVTVAITVIALLDSGKGLANESDFKQPTPAPPPSIDELTSNPNPTSIPLAKPLETREETLQQVLFYDKSWASWEEAWTLDTLHSAPERIIIEKFSSRTEESAASGENAWYHPDVEADAGAVWSVTIKGNVQLALIGGDPEMVVDGVNYVISARTGNLLAIRGGIPERFKSEN